MLDSDVPSYVQASEEVRLATLLYTAFVDMKLTIRCGNLEGQSWISHKFARVNGTQKMASTAEKVVQGGLDSASLRDDCRCWLHC